MFAPALSPMLAAAMRAARIPAGTAVFAARAAMGRTRFAAARTVPGMTAGLAVGALGRTGLSAGPRLRTAMLARTPRALSVSRPAKFAGPFAAKLASGTGRALRTRSSLASGRTAVA